MKLELGTGAKPTAGFVHHDRWKHAPHIDLAFDLDAMPWPIVAGSVTHLLAIDVFEHMANQDIMALVARTERLHEDIKQVAFALSGAFAPDGTFSPALLAASLRGLRAILEPLPAMDMRSHVQQFMDECHRVVAPGGILEFRYPHHDNDYSFRDPTHRHLPRHTETWHFWCPDAPGTVWQNFGRYYFGEGYDKWWSFRSAVIDKAHGSKDVRVTLCKP